MVEEKKYSKLAIWSFLLSVLSLLLFIPTILLGIPFVSLCFLLLPLSLIFGILGLKSINKSELRGKALAIVGITVSGVFIVLVLMGLIIGVIKMFTTPPFVPASEEPDAPPAYLLEPLTMSRPYVILSPGSTVIIKTNVFNSFNNTLYQAEPFIDGCNDLNDEIISKSMKKDIAANSTARYTLSLETANNITKGKHICTLCIRDVSSNNNCNGIPFMDFLLEVK